MREHQLAAKILINKYQGTLAAHCRVFRGVTIKHRRSEPGEPCHKYTWIAFSNPFPSMQPLAETRGQRDTAQASRTYKSATGIRWFQAGFPQPCVAEQIESRSVGGSKQLGRTTLVHFPNHPGQWLSAQKGRQLYCKGVFPMANNGGCPDQKSSPLLKQEWHITLDNEIIVVWQGKRTSTTVCFLHLFLGRFRFKLFISQRLFKIRMNQQPL